MTHDFMCFAKIATASQSQKWEDFWIHVHGFWLEITEKVGHPSSYVLPLDIANLAGAFQETSVQNSLSLSLHARAGGLQLFLQSTNRCDIIQLFNALKAGHALLTEALTNSAIPNSCECDIESSSGFFGMGKSKLHLKESPVGFELTGPKASYRYAFEDIQSVQARLNHTSAHTRLIINVKENGAVVAKEYNCVDHEQLLNVIQCFLMNSFAWERENAGPPVPIGPMGILPIE
jgi:hypothetical protein